MNSIDKKDLTNLKKICEALKLGTLENVSILDSSQNIVYKVATNEKTYVIKEYSKDAIRDEEDLIDRKRQVSVSEQMSQNGVPAILPLKFNKKSFIHYKGKYFLVYDFLKYKILSPEEITNKKIKKLANTLAIIHKLNIKCDLPCQYEKINTNYEKYLKKFKQQKIDSNLIKVLEDNIITLNELSIKCNENIKNVKEHLCISHNDYKLGNILWNKDFMYLIDFDACCLSNPAVSLAESSFSLSRQNNKVNKDFYKEYLTTYIKKFGPLNTDYQVALDVAMNGKLQWLNYLLSKCNKKNQTIIDDTKYMIEELALYYDNKEEFYKLYLTAVKNKTK